MARGRKYVFLVRPWYDEGEDWPEEPGVGQPIIASSNVKAWQRYDELWSPGSVAYYETKKITAAEGVAELEGREGGLYGCKLDDAEQTLLAELRERAEKHKRKPKAADISDERFLRTVLAVFEEDNTWTNTWHLEERISEFPLKVVVAKAGQLIKRDMLDGCTCGCRGDFELAPRGMDFLLDADLQLLCALLDYSDGRAIKWEPKSGIKGSG